VQAGLAQRARLAGQQRAVGGQRQVLDAGNLRQPRNQLRQAAPQQRLAAGEAQLAHALAHEGACRALDLVEGQARLGVEHFVRRRRASLRHAVGTAVVTGFDHRDAQVVQRAAAQVASRAPG
jgi:hypothetical protein